VIDFPIPQNLKNHLFAQENRYKVRKNLGKLMEVGYPI
jgi:hypothetical protein